MYKLNVNMVNPTTIIAMYIMWCMVIFLFIRIHLFYNIFVHMSHKCIDYNIYLIVHPPPNEVTHRIVGMYYPHRGWLSIA